MCVWEDISKDHGIIPTNKSRQILGRDYKKGHVLKYTKPLRLMFPYSIYTTPRSRCSWDPHVATYDLHREPTMASSTWYWLCQACGMSEWEDASPKILEEKACEAKQSALLQAALHKLWLEAATQTLGAHSPSEVAA